MIDKREQGHARSVLDAAADMDKRQGFLQHLEARGEKLCEQEQYAEMEAYFLSDACPKDLERLRDGDYFLPPPFHYRVPKNASRKMRDVYAFRGRDLFLMRLISWVMHDDDDALMPEGLYSFRRGVQARDFLMKLREFPNLGRYYVVKSDVSNYGGSIVPEKLIPQLEALWPEDPALLNLLKFLLLRRTCIEKDGRVVRCEPGGLSGVPVSNCFVNVYLMDVDRYFYPRAPLYCRYSDDVVILAESRAEAEAYLERLLGFLDERKLVTNSEKTRLIPPGEPVDILGYKVCDGVIDISDHALAKVERRLRMKSRRILRDKQQLGMTDAQAARQMVEYCNYKLFGEAGDQEWCWARWYFPVINTVEGLRRIDHYAQNAIRFAMCGTMGNRRFNMRYDGLRAMGYRSLVHAYYHTNGEKGAAPGNPDGPGSRGKGE